MRSHLLLRAVCDEASRPQVELDTIEAIVNLALDAFLIGWWLDDRIAIYIVLDNFGSC